MARLISKVDRVSYHRNGVMGAGFYTVEFTVGSNLGRGMREVMVGVVSNWSPEPSEQHLFPEPFYAVMSLEHPERGYRGDEFWPELRDAIDHANRFTEMHYATTAWTQA